MRKTKIAIKILYFVLVFLFGFLAAFVWDPYLGFKGLTGSAVNAPSDFINPKEVLLYPDKIVIKINNAQLTNYESSGSMGPILGNGANGIIIEPDSEDNITVGDIVTFYRDGKLIVHRVMSKGVDEKGVYFVTKGDGNIFSDGKVRFEEIEHKLVGIIY